MGRLCDARTLTAPGALVIGEAPAAVVDRLQHFLSGPARGVFSTGLFREPMAVVGALGA
jgi:hypothetical protein